MWVGMSNDNKADEGCGSAHAWVISEAFEGEEGHLCGIDELGA